MELKIIDKSFSVCKVKDYSMINIENEFCFTGKTDEENSLVCAAENVPENVTERDDGWKAFRIQGILDFSLIGILSNISSVLAENKIGLFAVSTYNTDYIFIKEKNFDKALALLQSDGYTVIK
ncbi:MAG: ACT domain-containing protein [Clostridia bacterium]|nr:ACT domain-containing protein [Clostridia bacterium]